MKLSKNKLNNDQPKSLSKRNDKKSVNIKWNSKLFFQLGIIVALFAVYFIMEIKFKDQLNHVAVNDEDFLTEYPMFTYVVEKPTPIPKKKVAKKITAPKVIKKVFTVLPDDGLEIEDSIIDVPSIENPITETTTIIQPKKEETVLKNVFGVEFVPVFPGCESLSTNNDKRNCMSLKIRKYIGKKFNTDIIEDDLSVKTQKVFVQFTIDINGNVSNVSARAPSKVLEKEAIRVVSNLPKMIPGRQGKIMFQYNIEFL